MVVEPGTIEMKAHVLTEVAKWTPPEGPGAGMLFVLVAAHLTVEAPELWGPIADHIVADFVAWDEGKQAATGIRHIVQAIKDA